MIGLGPRSHITAEQFAVYLESYPPTPRCRRQPGQDGLPQPLPGWTMAAALSSAFWLSGPANPASFHPSVPVGHHLGTPPDSYSARMQTEPRAETVGICRPVRRSGDGFEYVQFHRVGDR